MLSPDVQHEIAPCLVVLLSTNGEQCGMGFVIHRNLVCTCAHVVSLALNGRAAALEIDHDRSAALEFEFCFPPKDRLRARVVHWGPASADANPRDVAILALTEESPRATGSIPSFAYAYPDRSVEVFGLGDVAGRWAKAVTTYRNDAGWIQLQDNSTTGPRIVPGYSGTPVWDAEARAVVGMVVAYDRDIAAKVAFMIPIEDLARPLVPLCGRIRLRSAGDPGAETMGDGVGRASPGRDGDFRAHTHTDERIGVVANPDPERAANYLLSKSSRRPRIAFIAGSGFPRLEDPQAEYYPYTELPHFPATLQRGPMGGVALCDVAGLPACVVHGQIHAYEEHGLTEMVFRMRFLASLGIDTVVFSAAVGGLSPDLRPGSLVLVRDHMNLGGTNPLVGAGAAEYGSRFVDMADAYSARLRSTVIASAKRLGIAVTEGVYAYQVGPSYETAAEAANMLRSGADVVGMSVVPEVIAARHANLDVLAICCVTAMSAGCATQPLTLEGVLETAARTRSQLADLLFEFAEALNAGTTDERRSRDQQRIAAASPDEASGLIPRVGRLLVRLRAPALLAFGGAAALLLGLGLQLLSGALTSGQDTHHPRGPTDWVVRWRFPQGAPERILPGTPRGWALPVDEEFVLDFGGDRRVELLDAIGSNSAGLVFDGPQDEFSVVARVMRVDRQYLSILRRSSFQEHAPVGGRGWALGVSQYGALSVSMARNGIGAHEDYVRESCIGLVPADGRIRTCGFVVDSRMVWFYLDGTPVYAMPRGEAFYADGHRDASIVTGSNRSDGDPEWNFDPSHGRMADVAIWHRALTCEEIQAIQQDRSTR